MRSTSSQPAKCNFVIGIVKNIFTGLADYYLTIFPPSQSSSSAPGDAGLWGLCNFQLLITDINNNAPIFDPSVYRVILQLGLAYGPPAVQLTQVIAIDGDDPDQATGQVLYRFKGTANPIFNVNGNTGAILISGTPTAVCLA
ncbi:unnamed protein product [Protopolystoma xenopodis]|uniref:Cadherin domain-containing protein n=1 Tax=Protopolystoma xenopodis TaxID=117903 RepID=A0A3S5CQJ3_9PLAT|nr:unnamed protein product [Protopolystoma xenopodis]